MPWPVPYYVNALLDEESSEITNVCPHHHRYATTAAHCAELRNRRARRKAANSIYMVRNGHFHRVPDPPGGIEGA